MPAQKYVHAGVLRPCSRTKCPYERWDALTQLQETATSGTPERYLIILFTRDNPFPSRSRRSGRGWRIALVKTLNKQTASRNAQLLLAPAHALE